LRKLAETERKSGDTEEDWSLYAKFEKGDTAAFHRLFDRYKNRVLTFSYRFVRNAAVAEDIARTFPITLLLIVRLL